MELPKFSTLSTGTDKAVPFKLNEQSLVEWLKGVESSNDYYLSCRQIFAGLESLNTKEVEPKLRYSLLDRIGLGILPMVKRLEQTFLSGSIPLPPSEKANYELIASTYAALAQGYWRTASDIIKLPHADSMREIMAKALFAGLEALKRLLLCTSEVYERPYKGFWNACYQFYRMAEGYKLLELKVLDLKRHATISGSFKSLLVFYLSGPSQFNPRAMRELLKFVEQYSDTAKIHRHVDEQEQRYFFRFFLDSDDPPSYSKHQIEETSGVGYLSTIKIAKSAYDVLNSETTNWNDSYALKESQLAIVVKNLGMGVHRKFIRVSVKKHYFGIVGYDNILNYLRNSATHDLTANAESLDPRIAGTWKLPDLELLPISSKESSRWKKLGEDNEDRHIDIQLGLDQSQQEDVTGTKETGEKFGEFNIVDSNIKGYGIISKEINMKETGLGDFIGIINSDGENNNRLEVGIIRRIGKPEPGMIGLGVELIAYEADATCIFRPGNLLTKSWAVILRGIQALKQTDSMIFYSHTFNVGEEVCLERGMKVQQCVIKKILYATPAVAHVEIEYLANPREKSS